MWVWFIPGGHTHPLRELYTELHANSVSVPGPVTEILGAVAAECGATVAIGVNERNSEASDSTLFNTLLYIGSDGSVLGRHRKLVPTTAEKLVWARGDGSDLEVYDLPFGRLSGLICWENYMPLARYALTAWGAQLHAAPTWDRGEPWLSTMRHVAKEGRVFVLGLLPGGSRGWHSRPVHVQREIPGRGRRMAESRRDRHRRSGRKDRGRPPLPRRRPSCTRTSGPTSWSAPDGR